MSTEKYTPIHMKRWEAAENHLGEEYPDYYVIVSRSRDASVAEESNWHTISEAFKRAKGVISIRASHWAVGYVEMLLIHENSAAEDLEEADRIVGNLKIDPIYDDTDYGERSKESISTYIDENADREFDIFFGHAIETPFAEQPQEVQDDWKELLSEVIQDPDEYLFATADVVSRIWLFESLGPLFAASYSLAREADSKYTFIEITDQCHVKAVNRETGKLVVLKGNEIPADLFTPRDYGLYIDEED